MRKNINDILLLQAKEDHNIYLDKASFITVPPLGDVLIYPMVEECYMPYMQYNIQPTTEYQKAVLELAYYNSLPIIAVYPCDIEPLMTGDLVASKFKGCRGLIGVVKYYESGQEDDPKGTDALIQTLFQAEVKSGHWSSDLVGASVKPAELKYIERTPSEEEIGVILEERFNSVVHFLVPDSQKNMNGRLSNLPKDTLERLSFMTQYSPLSMQEMTEVALETDLSRRRRLLIKRLSEHAEKLSLREEINHKTLQQMTQNQRADFLRNQIKMIQQELNMVADDDEVMELYKRAEGKNWSASTQDAFQKEMRRLSRYMPNSPEYALQYSYLETFLSLPWDKCDNTVFELDEVRRVLDRDHYAMDKVKERIVEQMAVLKLRQDMKSPILCLVGPAGVGKTSLGKSIAEALGRKYVRVALGGVHDEAEIRGHRRTYLGSMPGRIIAALEKCGTSDPVMVLDEIDKLGADYKGDPSTALLEVLDPEQNHAFHDNYLDHDYDLSHILFIATANTLDSLSQPLLDRMEVIEVGGYLEDEKVHIAQDHLIPRNLERNGFGKDEVKFTDDALRTIITYYTRESGVRKLEKRISEILRKLACKKASNLDFYQTIDSDIVRQLLGKESVYPEMYENSMMPGVVIGLAWTPSGGDILYIESVVYDSEQPKIELTGNLGNVMKESATLAMQYLRSNVEKYGIKRDLGKSSVHIHVPEGAIPKDGPSAGITMLTSLASTLTGKRVKPRLAMTGELTLRGKILPVGGIKEKIMAARQAGIQEVILCKKNQKDIEEIPQEYLTGMQFHFVETADEVLGLALLDAAE